MLSWVNLYHPCYFSIIKCTYLKPIQKVFVNIDLLVFLIWYDVMKVVLLCQ